MGLFGDKKGEPRTISLAATAVACAALVVGCGSGTSRVVLYPFNNAKGTEVSACKASIAKEKGLTPALRSALETNCAHNNTAAVEKAATQSATQQCQAALNTAGLSKALKNELASSCSTGTSNPTSTKTAAAQTCQQIIKSTVPKASQQQALASCPKP